MDHLARLYGDATMGSDSVKTGLCIFTTSLQTLLATAFTNHPDAPAADLTHRVSTLVAASIASPGFLRPVEIDSSGAFHINGSLSVGMDPALSLFGIATSPIYPFQWRDGEARLLLISTAAPEIRRRPASPKPSLLEWIGLLGSLSMNGAAQQARLLLSRLGAREHDVTVAGDRRPPWGPLTYRRFAAPAFVDDLLFDDVRALD